MNASLTVDFAGEIHRLQVGEELTFGRGRHNDLVIDSNPLLHRSCGHIFHRDGAWWLKNKGRRIHLVVRDDASPTNVTLTSDREAALLFARATISFKAGNANYELLIEVPDLEHVSTSNPEERDEDDPMNTTAQTIDQSHVPLVGDQRLLAIALAEAKLRNPHDPIELPSNRAIAHRFGWSMTAFNRKLDRLCRKYARAGVSGLVGGSGDIATDRRRKLVEHLVGSGALTIADLELLEQDSETDS